MCVVLNNRKRLKKNVLIYAATVGAVNKYSKINITC